MNNLVNELQKYEIDYIAIQDQTSFNKICDLFCHNVLFEPGNTIEYLYIAIYYDEVKQNHSEAKHYYLMAINGGDINAMNNLACHYENVRKNYKKAKNYYLMAINSGNAIAMNNLAYYYLIVEKNYVEAERFFSMAIDNGNLKSISCLAYTYLKIEKCTNEKKYPKEMLLNFIREQTFDIMIIYNEHGSENMLKLSKFCITNVKQIHRNIIIEVVKILWRSILNLELAKCFAKLLLEFEILNDDDVPASLKIFSNVLRYKNNVIRMHFEYTINSVGYEKTKKHFEKLVI